METPNTQAGQITEQVMAVISRRLPNMKTHDYNRTYEDVLEVLSLHFPPASGIVKFPEGGGMMISRRRV